MLVPATDRIDIVKGRHERGRIGIVRHRLRPVRRQPVVWRENRRCLIGPAILVDRIEGLVAMQVLEFPDAVFLDELVLVDSGAPLRLRILDTEHNQ